jgi:ankyrin repeat protein
MPPSGLLQRLFADAVREAAESVELRLDGIADCAGTPGHSRALLDRGADTARINDRGQTALAAAVFRRSVESVTQLLVAGADPALGPRSALDVAHVFELPEMLALLTR